ncbi:MAG: hypothetical protein L6Q99_16060 [Planctomycetes bacterium]|nr:hypothetical protein [Planctomycetota bacterium]
MANFDLDDACFELPFPDFVRTAIEWIEAEEWDQEDAPMFHFVRSIKGYSAAKQRPAAEAYAAVVNAAPKATFEPRSTCLDLWSEDGEVGFHHMWERVRFPMRSDPLDVACAAATTGLLRTQNQRPGKYTRFLTIAALLQIQVREKPILLPVRRLAEAFPCQPNTITAWTAWARQDGVLVKVRDHAFRSTGDSRAAEYVFGLHCWSEGMDRVAALLAVKVSPSDIAWTRERFEEAAESA